MIRTFEHITITSGAVRMASRSAVSSHILPTIRPLIAGKAQHDYRVRFLDAPRGGHVFEIDWQQHMIVRCWLCLWRGVGDAMWDAASGASLDERVVLERPRSVPWLAAALVPDALGVAVQNPHIIGEVGNLEHCLAWPLIDGEQPPNTRSAP